MHRHCSMQYRFEQSPSDPTLVSLSPLENQRSYKLQPNGTRYENDCLERNFFETTLVRKTQPDIEQELANKLTFRSIVKSIFRKTQSLGII